MNLNSTPTQMRQTCTLPEHTCTDQDRPRLRNVLLCIHNAFSNTTQSQIIVTCQSISMLLD
uniref:Uncharacterized protein n=1 Tax=Anguilla anguilla TaxID=7936 RepID=A0A0E9XVR7_ANGAN